MRPLSRDGSGPFWMLILIRQGGTVPQRDRPALREAAVPG